MDPAIAWNEAEGNPLADQNPSVGPQAVGEGVFARLLAAIDNFKLLADSGFRRPHVEPYPQREKPGECILAVR